MTKLVYPEEGIYSIVLGHHRNAVDYLNYAYNQSSFDLPTSLGYSYRSYLYGIDDKIKYYRNTMEAIINDINKVNTKMENIVVDLTREVAQKLPDEKVKERERLIL